MKAPQIIFTSMLALQLLMTAVLHGKPRDSKYSIWTELMNTAVTVGLLAWGGFYS